MTPQPLQQKDENPAAPDGSIGGGGGGVGKGGVGSNGSGKPPLSSSSSSGGGGLNSRLPSTTSLSGSGAGSASRPPPPPQDKEQQAASAAPAPAAVDAAAAAWAAGGPSPATSLTGSTGTAPSSARTTSAGSLTVGGGSVASDDSRRALRRTMMKKKKSLRQCEFGFLETLLKEGDDAELELAREKLADANLFFDSGTGGEEDGEEEKKKKDQVESVGADVIAAKPELAKGGGSRHPSDESSPRHTNGTTRHHRPHAPSDEIPPSSPVGLPRAKSMFARSPPDADLDLFDGCLYEDEANDEATNGDDNKAGNDKPGGKGKAKAKALWTKLGSAARLAQVANRRQSKLHSSIWRAHESGLSVTAASSQKSVLARRKSAAFIATATPASIQQVVRGGDKQSSLVGVGCGGGSRRAAFLDSVGRESFLSGSVIDVVEDGKHGPRHIPGENEVFRDSVGSLGSECLADSPKFLADSQNSFRQGSMGSGFLADSQRSQRLRRNLSGIPRPGKIGRGRRSVSIGSVPSRAQSVTFKDGHDLHEFRPGENVSASDGVGSGPNSPTKGSKFLLPPLKPISSNRRRAVSLGIMNMNRRERLLSSDSIRSSTSLTVGGGAGQLPFPPRPRPAVRSDSVVSEAPSLNLHRAHTIRSDSVLSEAPSLNLHRAHAIRSDSVLSEAPSLNLHRAHHIMSESTLSLPPPSPPRNLGRPYPMLQRDSSAVDSVLTFDDESMTGSGSEGVISPRSSEGSTKKVTAWAVATGQMHQHQQPIPPPPLQRPPSALRPPLANQPKSTLTRPVLMRMASASNGGEGVEVAELDTSPSSEAAEAAMSNLDSIDNARRYRSIMSDVTDNRSSVYDSFSSMNLSDFVRTDIFRRSLSFDDVLGDVDSNASALGTADYAEQGSWDLESEPDQQDAWNVLADEYAVGYSSVPFVILGTSADDVDAQPHALSPPLMESLQPFFPYSVTEDNFWMKYSLVRDGASLHTLLQNIRGAKYTIIGIETVEGEVFGSFTSSPWRKNWNYFGTGESFLWRMKQSRGGTQCHSVIDQAQLESELEVFPWTGENTFVQLCTSNKIAVGGGTVEGGDDEMDGDGNDENAQKKTSWDEDDATPFGFGLAIEDTLMQGTSNPCLTFGSPSLSKRHSDGSPFEILNMEVWTLTPCMSLEEAEKLELGRLFLEDHKQR